MRLFEYNRYPHLHRNNKVYPKHDSYSFIDLIQELKKDKAAKNQNALKVYLVSTEQIKSNSTLEYIKESSEYFELKNAVYNPSPEVPSDIDVTDMNINKIMSIKYLDIIKKRLPNELSRKIKESLAMNEDYQKLTSYNVYGFFTYEFDEMKKNGYPLLLFIEKSYLCNQQMKLFINLKLI